MTILELSSQLHHHTVMRNSKQKLATVAIIGTALSATSAMASPFTPVTVSDVQVNWNQGEGTILSTGGIYYAGPITFTIAGKSVTVWCDDLANEVYIGSSSQYFQTDAQGANAYLLNPTLTMLQQATLDSQIAGLVYQGTILSNANSLTPVSGAQFQMAIWELENPTFKDIDLTFQMGVDSQIAKASSYYDAMVQAGYTYGQLVSPSCAQSPGTLTYTSVCQTQGQIFVTKVPEPLTLSLFGAGLAGAAALRRRRQKKMAV